MILIFKKELYLRLVKIMDMAKKNNKNQNADSFVQVEEVLSKSEQFLEKNQKPIIIALSIIVLIVLGFMGYNRYIKSPKELKAQQEVFVAQQYFAIDSMNLALNGDGNNAGFLEIIDEYGSTTVGNTANYYAGICYLHLGEYETSIDFLNDFSHKGKIAGMMAEGAIGDAYMELGNQEKAKAQYKKAANLNNNDFISPTYLKKAAITAEILGDYKEAKELYERIKTEYPTSTESRDIDKFIARIDQLLSN